MNKTIILTGGAGFMGSNFVKRIACRETDYEFLILDALTYAGRRENIEKDLNSRIRFALLDIRKASAVEALFQQVKPHGVIHLAAETHVDRSITEPDLFVQTNVLGTSHLLNSSLKVFHQNPEFRFLHVSTDEVYGSLSEGEKPFRESHPLRPNSPYSASKASADLLVMAYYQTYQLPGIITRCSNNYGPYQFPEKLIPLMIKKAFHHERLPVYGTGQNIRDWIYVDDHNEGLWKVFTEGQPGSVYNFGGNSERTNLEVVKAILSQMNRGEELIKWVKDRQGHDFRYGMDFSKVREELGWTPQFSFEEGLKKTIRWYEQSLRLTDHHF